MALMDFNEFTGAESPPAGPPPSPPASGGAPTPVIPFEAFKSAVVPSGEKPEMVAARAFEKGLAGAKAVGGEAAALADLVLSIPGFMISTGAQIGATATGLLTGESPATAYASGREIGHKAGEPFMSPLYKVMQLFKSGKAYEEAATTKGMEKLMTGVEEAGEWVEENTGGRIPADSVPMLVETLMAGSIGLVKGQKPGAIPTHITKALRESAQKLREQGDAAAVREMEAAKERQAQQLTPEEFAARVTVQKQVNELLGIRTPKEQAAWNRARQKDIRAAMKEPQPGDYGSIEESMFRAEERLSNEASYRRETAARENEARIDELLQEGERPIETRPKVEPFTYVDQAAEARAQAAEAAHLKRVNEFNVNQTLRMSRAEAQRILEKPGASRTPAELQALKIAAQEGRATPEALAMLGAAGLGGVAGMVLDEEQLRGAALGAASGLSFVLPFVGRGASVPKKMGQSGAVKAPGGMWHPEAVERLSEPLARQMMPESEVGRWYDQRYKELGVEGPATPELVEKAGVPPKYQWANKAIRNYLNRYAGTERDPLKDIEIPYAGGVKRWEEVADRAFTNIAATEKGKAAQVRPGEPVWTAGDRGTTQAIESYLSHVGDYLRQNVKPEKLKDYDLVRAVKETAENDRKMAKQMEKAQADSTKTLPVHKEYPDGFKWIELKLPEKLTEEQAKTVKRATKGELRSMIMGDEGPYGLRPDDAQLARAEGYVALDAAGKPVKNAYTGELAGGPTPEEAWLAGRLAEEGNIMGHCVGGYCEGVASGESRIFSLRDPKGGSHVTIEVDPRLRGGSLSGDMLMERFGARGKEAWEATRGKADMHGLLQKDFPDIWKELTETPDISQIKGKQNRAPEAKYLPYVQDFVKEGKWGEVGDLGNAGLERVANFKPDVQTAIKANHGEAPYITRAELETTLNGMPNAGWPGPTARPPGGRQAGFVDQKLLVGAGGIGLGGLIGSLIADDPTDGVILGALAGTALSLPKVQIRLRDAARALDQAVTPISTRILLKSPPLARRLLDYEWKRMVATRDSLNHMVPWMKEVSNLPGAKRQAIYDALFAGDREGLAALYKGNPTLVAAWRQARNALNDLGERAKELGRFKDLLEEYFPRRVKDFRGLRNALEAPVRERLDQMLRDAERKAIRAGRSFTEAERDAIINRELKNFYVAHGKQPGYAKARKLEAVTQPLQEFYYSPQEALYITTREAVADLEMARLFGKDLVQIRKGGREYINTEASIGNVIGRELAEGRITPEDVTVLEGILRDRFGPGERSPAKLMQELKAIGYLGTIGDVLSAITQFGDPLLSMYTQGPRATITAVARRLSGNKKIGVEEFGLADHIAEEFASGSALTVRSARAQRRAIAGGAVAGAAAAYGLTEDPFSMVAGTVAGAYIGLVGAVGASNALNKVFRQTAFSAVDRFGKDIQLGGAHSKLTRWAQDPKGVARLKDKYGEFFAGDFPQLVRDLQEGKMTDLVRSAAFFELSRIQPVSKMEMPQAYLRHPNGRIMWQLKTFMLKQLDILRRDAFEEIRKGNVKKGIANLTTFSIVLGLSGTAPQMIKDWLAGREVDFSVTDIPENMLKTFGLSQYVLDKARRGEPVAAIGGTLLPPYQVMERIIAADPKAVQHIPVIGKLYYSWELGGREKTEIRKARESGAPLSAGARRFQREEQRRREREARAR